MREKKISDMLQIVKEYMLDAANWPNGKIDTIVNAAKPTLMESNQGVYAMGRKCCSKLFLYYLGIGYFMGI